MDEYNTNGWKLSHHNWARRKFDPANPVDLAEYEHFLHHNKWHDRCPFILEWPFNNVIDMIERKIIKAHLSHLIEKQALAKTRRS